MRNSRRIQVMPTAVRSIVSHGAVAHGGFDKFAAQWGDFVLECMQGDESIQHGHETAWLKGFYERGINALCALENRVVYRGIAVQDDWLEYFSVSRVLGVHWTDNQSVAIDFTHIKDYYDERFRGMGGVNRVLIRAEFDPHALDIHATVASRFSAGESELRFKEGFPIARAAVQWNGGEFRVFDNLTT